MIKNHYTKNGWDKLFHASDIENVDVFLQNTFHDDLQFCGMGGTCIVFKQTGASDVIKVCSKTTSVTKTAEMLNNFSKKLFDNGIKVLPVKSILYEDEKFFIYTQEICTPIQNINTFVLKKILEIVRGLIQKNVKISDIFYKNFGLCGGDVFLYDYHDVGTYDSDDHYYIGHITHLFSMYYFDKLFHGVHLSIRILKEKNFGKDVLPENVVEMLICLYNFQFERAVDILTEIINELGKKLVQHFDNYQHYDFNSDGELNLRSHTLEKYNMFEKIKGDFTNDIPFTVIDFGCSLGGIGLKIAQTMKNSDVTLNNITKSELIVCENNIRDYSIINAKVKDVNIINERESYDVTLYFAILHHVLKSKTIDEIIDMVVRQTKKYSIIELPFGDDSLLKDVISNGKLSYNNTYYYLESIERFTEKVSQFFCIEHCQKIDYDSPKLNRYALVLKKK